MQKVHRTLQAEEQRSFALEQEVTKWRKVAVETQAELDELRASMPQTDAPQKPDQ